MMRNFTLLMLMAFGLFRLQAQVYEDFDTGTAKLPWAAVNGATYGGAVANPAKDAVNDSDHVGKLSNNDQSDFCFLLTDLPAPADLSVNNLLKMKLWSPIAPTRILLKFEGGGKAVEKFVDVTVANVWVDYTFDLSGGASFTTLTKILLAVNPFTTPQAADFYFDDIRGVEARDVYETFETGNEMGWLGLDGTLEAPVANPSPNKVNSSAQCGKYFKSGMHSYSLLLADRGTNPFDFSINNQVKLQVNASAPTQILFKLEGPGGPAIEKFANIGLTGQWQEYTFDFSAAKEYTHLTKAIIFFDPGVETSVDTYYFDNITAVPKGVCENVTPDPKVVDDFECNRNSTYVNGWDSLTVVTNPAPNAVNNSSKVGRYADNLTEQWAALLFDNQNPIDLTVNNQLKIKVWSPRAVPILFKLEGGASPVKEIWANVTDVNQWIEYEIDFSNQAIASHKKLVIFFNAGMDAQVGDVYYIDDISWGEKSSTDLENFENGASLPWEPLEQNTVTHGVFSVVDNPSAVAPNISAKVGKYAKGASAFSTLAAVAPGVIDISVKPQYNVQVWAPVGTQSVTMQLESVSDGNKEVEREIKNAGNWEELSFDFTAHQGISDWASLRFIFNPGVAEEGVVYYFDNLSQGEATVDPCEGTERIATIIDDFECQRNYEYGAGSALITVVNNPKTTTVNSSTKVGLYKDQPNEPWSALCALIPDGLDLEVFNQLNLQVLSTTTAPVLLKLEGGTSPAKEIWTEITTVNDWQTLSADFSGEAGNNHQRVCVFFNGGVATTTEDDYYIDNFQFNHAPYDGCIMNFDDAAFVSDKWLYFPSAESGAFELVDNPKTDGINKSAKVGKAVEKASGEQPWQGMYTDLASYIKFGSNKLIKMKVLSPQVGPITMKLERPLKEGAPGSGDNTIVNTKANEWQELTWDFSTTPIVDDGLYARVTLIWDINQLPANDVIYYFDDIKLEGGNCGDIVSTDDASAIGALEIAPNPVSSILYLKNTDKACKFVISDILGRTVAMVSNTTGYNEQLVDVSGFKQGTYVIASFDAQNRQIAIAKFIKY
ncbi:MAG: T9SS type A sorting domain-containing protein [Saprospiraceae bacterium]|nr:T9SS type A sorting domain-containing protein [Saprospiraceae bacterium]